MEGKANEGTRHPLGKTSPEVMKWNLKIGHMHPIKGFRALLE